MRPEHSHRGLNMPSKPAPDSNDKTAKSEQFGMRNFHLAGRSTVHAQNGMVATSHPLAALAAIEVLRAGGTAADAAVAACALLGVIEPQSTGIGGDCFALLQPKGEGKIMAYNGSGRAPQAATAEWYLERKINAIPLTSAHAVSHSGRGRRLGDHPARSRQARVRHPAAARDQGRGRRLCRRARASPSTGTTSSRS